MFGSEESCKPVRPNSRRRKMKPPGGESHDLWGAAFTGSPSHLRVLKPPGGGSSDIFGSAEPVEPQRKPKTHLTSSIFAEDSAVPSRNKAVDTPAPAETPSVMNGTTSSTTSAAPTPTNTAPAAGKQRVPPGGFSSGLW